MADISPTNGSINFCDIFSLFSFFSNSSMIVWKNLSVIGPMIDIKMGCHNITRVRTHKHKQYWYYSMDTTVDKIKLKKMRKNYAVFNEFWKKITISIPHTHIPFGIESYKGNQIINLEIDETKNNELYNIIRNLEQLNEKIKNMDDIPSEFKSKGYYSFMKSSRPNCVILRCHLKNPRILGFKDDLTKSNGTAKIEIGSMWSNDNNFGVTLYLTELIAV